MPHAKTHKAKIVGTGFYVPDKVLTNQDLAKMVDTSDEWIVTRTGMKERHIAAKEQATSDLVIEASRRALKNAHLEVKDIDLIMVATVTPDTSFPSAACLVQAGLKAGQVPAFDLSAACTGFIYGMIVAEGLITTGVVKRVLLAGAETLSRITDWEDRATCVLLGDAAGAVVLEESRDESGILSSYWAADGNLGPLLIQPAGGSRMPATKETVEKKLHFLQMKGNEVFKNAVKRMSEAAEEALKRSGMTKDDITWLVPHQANMRIIKATGERLGVPEEKVFVNVQKYANVSSATIPIGLDELRAAGKLKKGDIVVMDAFGGGFTWGAIVYRW